MWSSFSRIKISSPARRTKLRDNQFRSLLIFFKIDISLLSKTFEWGIKHFIDIGLHSVVCLSWKKGWVWTSKGIISFEQFSFRNLKYWYFTWFAQFYLWIWVTQQEYRWKILLRLRDSKKKSELGAFGSQSWRWSMSFKPWFSLYLGHSWAMELSWSSYFSDCCCWRTQKPFSSHNRVTNFCWCVRPYVCWTVSAGKCANSWSTRVSTPQFAKIEFINSFDS